MTLSKMTHIILTVSIISYLNAELSVMMFSIAIQGVFMPSIIVLSIIVNTQNNNKPHPKF
jgi:hypothetical protein